MRKLKLQMVTSIDGFVEADHKGGEQIDWDNEALQFCKDNLKDVDCILLGRNTAEGFIPHWKGVSNDPKDNDYELGKLLTDIPKVVISKTLERSKWDNATISGGDILEQVEGLKKMKGKDIIVYGGYTFVSSLIQHGLIDEYFFLVSPVAYGSGKPIFNSLKDKQYLKLVTCNPFACGIVLLHYERKR